jgi:DNA-directed RNA polymerase specialized sigma subunit
MKISLHVGDKDSGARKAAQAQVLEHDILAVKGGDWNARNNLIRSFMPLLTSLARKRAAETDQLNMYIECAKEGLLRAARKYKPSVGAADFQIFALDYIESAMDKGAGRKKGFLSRFFGK